MATINSFELGKGVVFNNTKMTAIDSMDGLCCYGDLKGNLYVTQLDVNENCLDSQEVDNAKVIFIYYIRF